MICQNGIFHVRRRVPAALKIALGKGEIWRSLQTDSARIAARRFHGVAAMIEEEFERARLSLGLSVDETLIRPSRDGSPTIMLADIVQGVVHQLEIRTGGQAEPVVSKTIAEVYDAYLADPRQSWCPRTTQSYETTKRWVIDVFGSETPIRDITREACREFVTLLLHMPRFAYKRFPGIPIPKVVEMTLGRDDIPRISVANVNAYLIRFCCVMNWAEQEGFIERSPAKGLRVPDPVRKRDKRRSFSLEQLQRIFAAPLYTGCEDDWFGYNKPGHNRPRRARFFVPLIGLLSGMRLNEICDLDTADIVEPDGVPCFRVTTGIDEEDQHKRLKTAASERLVPVHRELLQIGLMAYVAERRRAGDVKLFPELPLNDMGQGLTELGDKLGPIFWQFMATKKFERDDFQAFIDLLPARQDGVKLRHAIQVRHESFAVPEFVVMCRKAGVVLVYADSPQYPAIADITGDFVYARLEAGEDDNPLGYPEADFPHWTKAARTWASGGRPEGLPYVVEEAPPKTPRETFIFFIHGGKVRAPAAAQALMARL